MRWCLCVLAAIWRRVRVRALNGGGDNDLDRFFVRVHVCAHACAPKCAQRTRALDTFSDASTAEADAAARVRPALKFIYRSRELKHVRLAEVGDDNIRARCWTRFAYMMNSRKHTATETPVQSAGARNRSNSERWR